MSCSRKGDTFSENYDNFECRVLTNSLSLCTCSLAEGLGTGGLLCSWGASPRLQLGYISSSVLALPEDQDYAGHAYWLCVALRSVNSFWYDGIYDWYWYCWSWLVISRAVGLCIPGCACIDHNPLWNWLSMPSDQGCCLWSDIWVSLPLCTYTCMIQALFDI